jgi:DNA-binding SARP family transcriptional activator/ABC-type transport system substrate-binding protein/outer membrane protein assembly factor BamB
MEYRLLGPLEVLDGNGHKLPLGGARQQSVLASLLLRAERTVPLEHLVEQLWEEPPASALKTVRVYISRLRQELRPGAIERRAGGYVFRLDGDRLDLRVFEQAAEEGRAALAANDCEHAARLLREALALWRGPALAGLTSEALRREAARLEELRLQVLEDRFEAELVCGRHRELVPELQALVAEEPFRERPRAQLMLALYRAGRPGDALELYRETRRLLVDELGIEPGEELRKLEQAILRQDDSLGPPNELTRPESSDGSRQGPSPPRPPPPRSGRRPRRPVLLIGLACAIGAAVALSLLLPRVFREDTAAAAFRPGTVLLDLKTHKQIAFLSPSQLASPRFPRYAGGHFWLFKSSPRSFVELDPSTGKVLNTFAPPDGMKDTKTNTPYAVDGRALWVGAGDDLVKVDTKFGEEVDRLHLDKIVGESGATQGVAVGGGLVWVGRDVGLGQVLAINPNTRKVRYRFNGLPHHVDLAYGDRTVWARDGGGVDVIDLRTETPTTVRELEKTDAFFGVFSPGIVVAAGGGFGWTTDSAKGLVYKIDRTGRVAARTPTGLGATGAHFHDGVLWVRSDEDEGTVTGIDAITAKPTNVYRFGHPVSAEVVGGGVLLATLEPRSNVRIGALTGKVARLFVQQGAIEVGDEPARNPLVPMSPADQIYFATCANLLNYPDKPGPAGAWLQPEVAAAMPILSADRRTYTFSIRRGYRFSPPSSQPLTAETFRGSIERALSPQLAEGFPTGWGPASGVVSDIRGERAFQDGTAQHISGLRASGNRLSITLTKPSASFLRRLAVPAFCPVPIGTPRIPGAANRSLAGTGDYAVPSAGPYYIADWRKGHYVILKRNPNYDGPRPHALDAIVLREGVDAAAALDQVRRGGSDGIVSSSTTSSESVDPLLVPYGEVASRYGRGSSNKDRYVPATYPQTSFIMLNSARGPFADRSVRRAAAFAVNRAANAAVWNSVASDQLLPPGFPAFHDRHLYPLGTPTRGALGKAAALMHGRRLDVVMAIQAGFPPAWEQGQLLRAALRPIGLRVRLKVFEDTGAAARKRGARIDMMDQGIYGQPDGPSFLDGVFFYAMPPSWVLPEVRRAVERVGRLWGSARQSAAAALADRLVARDVPLIPYGNKVNGEFLAPTLGCRVFPPASSGVDLASLCLSSTR